MTMKLSETFVQGENQQLQSMEELNQVCINNSALSPLLSSGSAGSTLTLEELDTLMSDYEDTAAFTHTAGSANFIMKELEQLVLTNNSYPAVQLTVSTDHDSSSLECLSIDSWSTRLMETDEEEGEDITSSSSLPQTPIVQPAVECHPSRADSQAEQVTDSVRRGDPSGFSSNRVNLIDMLQQCIASHMVADRSKVSGRKTNNEDRLVVRSNSPILSPGKEDEQRGYSVYSVSRDLMTLLHDCAHAVAVRDVANASSLAVTIRKSYGASPYSSDSRQRVAYYFVESLMARALETGTGLTAAAVNSGGPDVMEKVYNFRLEATPSPLIPHFFSTQAILDAFEGREVVHIVEIGMSRNRFQWSLLLRALAHRRGGPPVRLRVTAIDSPHHKPLLERLGMMIVQEANNLGMLAEVELGIAEANAWEGILPRIVCRTSPFEGLAVNSLFALDFLEDETAVQARSPRRAILAALHRMEPDVVVMGINHGNGVVPQFRFLERFTQAVTRFNAKFDAAAECGGANDEGRAAYEGRFLAPEILNLVACDGADRVVRTAPYDEWHRAMGTAGFHILPVNTSTLQKIHAMMGNYNRHFEAVQSDGWVKLSWKKVTTQCVSAWRPRRLV